MLPYLNATYAYRTGIYDTGSHHHQANAHTESVHARAQGAPRVYSKLLMFLFKLSSPQQHRQHR